MALLAKKTGGGGMNLGPLAPNGAHHAVCVDVIDLGMQKVTFDNNKPRDAHMVQVVWQSETRDPQTQKRYLLGKRYSLSLNEKANLRKDLESWFSKAITREQELNGIDVMRLIGRCGLINVLQVTKATGTYANVVTIMPPMKKLVADNYTRPASVEEPEHDDAADDDPFTQDAASAPPVGAGAAAAPITDDDIPF